MLLCGICKKAESRYSCPKCFLPYCSSECYRNPREHLSCSEVFFKAQIMSQVEGGSSMDIGDALEDKRKVYEMLQKSFDDDPGDSEIDLSDEDLRNLDKSLDGMSVEQLMGLLTIDQRMDFERKFKEKKLTINKAWIPWWHGFATKDDNENGNKKKVYEVSEMTWIESVIKETLLMPYPYIIQGCKSLKLNSSSMSSPKVQEAIMANISEVLLCYICACVYFNGDMEEKEGICSLLLESSAILSQKMKSFPNMEAVRSFIQQNGIRSGRTGEQMTTFPSINVILEYFDKDCKTIIMGSQETILLSLNHIHFLLKSCGKFRSMKTIEYFVKFVLNL